MGKTGLRRLFLLLMAAAASGAATANGPAAQASPRAPEAGAAALALRALDECIHRLDPRLDLGYPRIAERCPELTPALAASPWAPWLPRDWDRPGNELSAGGLTELRTLLVRPAPSARSPAPRVERVSAVLAGLVSADPPRGGWWTRLKQWLRELFTPRPQTADDGWLRRLFGGAGPSQAVLEVIGWSALAVLIALAAAIVANELRVAGVLRRRAARRAPVAAGADAARLPSLREVDEASPQQQPRLLLEVVVARLRSQERLPPARALTLHELARVARLPQPDDGARFAALAAACEQIRFAGHELPPAMLAAALMRGRELLGSLDASAMRAEAVG
jgi:hypothetical protein